jgi:LuxR family maltose regulon positive regulatory protein
MTGKISILKTKLSPPRLKSHILHRSTLTKKLKQVINFPLVLLHSGPGYGKSTVLSSFLREQSFSFCWYSITEQDDDLVPFITYVIQAIRTSFSDFGEELLTDLLHGDRYLREEDIISLGSRLVNELTGLPKETVLVLDDYHSIEHSAVIEDFLLWFIQHVPDQFHLVLSSRTRPRWDLLSTMKVKGNLLELTETDLAFNAEEIEVLFEDYYGFPLEPEQVEQIYHKTEGWVIAIQMIWQQLSAEVKLDKILQSNSHSNALSMDDLFDYLALEVLHKQPKHVQFFLEQTCIFDELTPSVCNEVLDIEDAEQIIEYLLHKNLFLFSVGEYQYRYHALFKDFLQNQLRKKLDLFMQLHQRAAQYFRNKNLLAQAIFHLQAIKDASALGDVLQVHGRRMIEQGQLESLLTILESISKPIKDRYYKLWVYEGEILRYRCLYQKSLICYQYAEVLAQQAEDPTGESLGFEGQARIYLDTIQPNEADQLLIKSIDALERSQDPDPEHQIRLYSLMAENLVNLGRAEEASKWYESSRSIRPDFDDEVLEARLHLRTGRLHRTNEILHKQKLEERANWNKHLPRSHRETDLLLSLINSFIGEPEKAKKSAEQGIMQGMKSKAPFVEACGWIRMGHAVQLLPKYDQQLALHCYQTALSIMEDINISRGKAEPFMGLCLLYGRERKLDKAIHYGDQALSETEKVNDMWLSALIRLCLGISFSCSERWDDASHSLKEAYDTFEQCGDSYGMTASLLWQAVTGFETQNWERYTSSMEECLYLMEKGEYQFLIQKRSMFGPRDTQKLMPLLLEAQKRHISDSYVSRLLLELGLENIDSHPGYTLRIQTLGEFRVWLGDREVIDKEWQRDKAKELFQLLVTKKEHLLPREEIFSLLWTDLDEKVANRDFKVALNALNKVLEPSRTARSTPFFVQRYDTAYGLHVTSAFELDSADFERRVKEGIEEKNEQQALLYLHKALELYTGDYLPERRHEDWCVDERERLQVLFLRGAERFAQLSKEMKEYDQAIYWCEQILQKDTCWEEAYRILMYCYYQKNNRPQAIKWYQKCCNQLKREIGVSPMSTTKQMYNMIMLNKKL